jgi:hypothetical protein
MWHGATSMSKLMHHVMIDAQMQRQPWFQLGQLSWNLKPMLLWTFEFCFSNLGFLLTFEFSLLQNNGLSTSIMFKMIIYESNPFVWNV